MGSWPPFPEQKFCTGPWTATGNGPISLNPVWELAFRLRLRMGSVPPAPKKAQGLPSCLGLRHSPLPSTSPFGLCAATPRFVECCLQEPLQQAQSFVISGCFTSSPEFHSVTTGMEKAPSISFPQSQDSDSLSKAECGLGQTQPI